MCTDLSCMSVIVYSSLFLGYLYSHFRDGKIEAPRG